MPEALRETSIFDAEAIEDVTVSVIDEPEFSVIELALDDRLIEGTDSSSVIVNVTCWSPSSVASFEGVSAPETPVIEMMAVSVPSDKTSSVGVKVVVPVN